MKKKLFLLCFLAVALVCMSVPVSAHHFGEHYVVAESSFRYSAYTHTVVAKASARVTQANIDVHSFDMYYYLYEVKTDGTEVFLSGEWRQNLNPNETVKWTSPSVSANKKYRLRVAAWITYGNGQFDGAPIPDIYFEPKKRFILYPIDLSIFLP